MSRRPAFTFASLLLLEALALSPADARRLPSANGIDPNACLNTYGVDLNQLYGLSDAMQTRDCREQSAGEHWVVPAWWIVHDGDGSVYPPGYEPARELPIEDFASKLVAVKVVVDAGTPAEKVHYFAAADVLRLDIDSEELLPGELGFPYPVASMLPRLAPVAAGTHTYRLHLLLSAQHCDGFGTVMSDNCLPAGEFAFAPRRSFEVTAPAHGPGGNLRARLQAIPGLRIVDDFPLAPDVHFFRLVFRQPVDHRDPGLGSFDQRLTLLHLDTQAPMVLHTTGYHLRDFPFVAEPTLLVGGNQISVEERFFSPSRPLPPDWSKLTIRQAAADHHRIVTAFSPIYPGRWLSTGNSKGGMATVYHRRFFPRDVDGTIVYAAPNDVDDAEDSAYTEFFQEVGTDPGCRAALTDLQNEALGPRRAALRTALAIFEAAGLTFDQSLGSPDRALEVVVLDLPFLFWQFFGQWACPFVPATDAPTAQIVGFIDAVTGLVFYTDQFIEPFVPYYVQAGTELGFPTPSAEALAGLLYPNINRPRSFVPAEIPLTFDAGAMADIDAWVQDEGSELLFLYGERDPWGAEPFRLGDGSTDSFRFTAPEANHSLSIFELRLEDQQVAMEALSRWAGLSGRPSARSSTTALGEPQPARGRVMPIVW